MFSCYYRLVVRKCADNEERMIDMALKNLVAWNKKTAASLTSPSCGSGDKAMGTACGSGDKVLATACGSGDKVLPTACGSGDK